MGTRPRKSQSLWTSGFTPHKRSTPPYVTTFKDWAFIDLSIEDAAKLVTALVTEGAGFACTSEPAEGRRIYFASRTSERIVNDFMNKREVKDA